jgi:DNA-binding Lrp family transcriptional regulator
MTRLIEIFDRLAILQHLARKQRITLPDLAAGLGIEQSIAAEALDKLLAERLIRGMDQYVGWRKETVFAITVHGRDKALGREPPSTWKCSYCKAMLPASAFSPHCDENERRPVAQLCKSCAGKSYRDQLKYRDLALALDAFYGAEVPATRRRGRPRRARQ